jgi:hypothetical protein
MNTVVNSGRSRLVTGAAWILATAGAAAWLAAFVYELQAAPEPSVRAIQHTSGPAAQAPAPGTAAYLPPATPYWAEVGRAAGR